MGIRFLGLAATLLLGCGLSSYEMAAGRFGAATTAAVSASRTVVGSAHKTCRLRATFHLIEARFQAPEFARGTEALALSSGVSTVDGKGTLTWGQYCEQLIEYDGAILGALSGLDAYASALKSVAEGKAIAVETGATSALVADAGDLAAELGAANFAKAREFAGPISALAKVTLDLIRTKKVRDAVRKGEGPASTVLKGVREYLHAAKLQLLDAESLRRQIVRSADAIIPVRPGGEVVPRDLPGQAIALCAFDQSERERLQTMTDSVEATTKLVDALAEAHAGLVKGTEAGVTDKDVLRFVASKVQEVVKQVVALRKISAGG